VFGAGALMMIVFAILLAWAPLQLTLRRVVLVSLVSGLAWLSLAWYGAKVPVFTLSTMLDLSPVLAALVAWAIFRWTGKWERQTIALSGSLVSLIAFGGMWGVMSVKPIFRPLPSEVSDVLTELQENHPQKLLVVPGERFNGALLNGFGFRSAAHAFLVPHPDALAEYFSDMPVEERHAIFNRMALLRVVPDEPLRAPGLGVFVPARSLGIARVRAAVLGTPEEPILGKTGSYDARVEGNRLIVEGWAPFRYLSKDQTLYFQLPFAVRSVDLIHVAGPLPGPGVFCGYNAVIEPEDPASLEAMRGNPISVFSGDPTIGVYELDGSGAIR